MGCGASVAAATAEQKEKMCVESCKNMMVSCVEHVINVEVIEKDSADVKISAPGDEVKSLRAFAFTLHKGAADSKAKAEQAGKDAESATAGAGAKLGGMLGGLGGAAGAAAASAAGAAAGAVGGAASAVAGAAGAGTDTVLTGLADGILSSLDALDAQFGAVAKELLSAKKKEIFDTYNKIIAECVFVDATALVRGPSPHGEKEYREVSMGAIAKAFNGASADKLEKALLEQVQEEINKSAVVKSWDSSIEKFNAGNEALGNIDFLKELKAEPIKLDINAYILKEVVTNLGLMMAKHENAVRADSKVRATPKTHTATFQVCFSPTPLTIEHWKAFAAGE